MATIWKVEQLRVYQRVLRVLPLLYDLIYSIPDNHQKLRKQLTSCGEGIAPLIAEGFAKKRNVVEFLRFLEMAMAESDELLTHLKQVVILANRSKRIRLDLCPQLTKEYTMVSKELFQLIKNWNKYPKK